MKLFLQPSRYTAHRIACIALYRALLEQCPRVQHLAEGWPATPLTFKHLIRKQFQRNRHLQSPRLVVAALKAGYQAEELLRKAGDGDIKALSKTTTILQEVEKTRTLSRANAAIPSPDRPKRRLPAPYPGAKSIFETRPRPLEELGGSGIRKAPVFINANLTPSLRFSKRHSPFLSRVLIDIGKSKTTRYERIEAMEGRFKMAANEDRWDSLVRTALEEEGGGGDGGRGRGRGGKDGEGKGERVVEGSWLDVLREQIAIDKEVLDRINRKKAENGRKMLELVSREEELVAKERLARRRARRKERALKEIEQRDGEDEKSS